MPAVTRLSTVDELARMSTDEPWELWEGELREVPGAGGKASLLAGVIFALIWPVVRSRKLGMVTTADGTYVLTRDPSTVVVPDVAFVRWDRLPGRVVPDGYIPVPPDLAVEVRSPSDEPGDIERKLGLYQGAGVPLVWWVDSDRRAVMVHRLGEPAVELGEADEFDGGDVLPGFRLPVAEIFSVV